jgi:hypothetical protein
MDISDETLDKPDAIVYVLHAGMHPIYFGFCDQVRRCLNGIISSEAYRRWKKTYIELMVCERNVAPCTIQLLRDTFRIEETLVEVSDRRGVSGRRLLDLPQPPADDSD